MAKRAFLIFECGHGWCIRPAKVGSVWSEEPPQISAFSRLTQALWWLGKHIREQDAVKSERDE